MDLDRVRVISTYFTAACAVIFAVATVVLVFEKSALKTDLERARKTIETLDKQIADAPICPETSPEVSPDKECPACPACATCPECAVCEPPTVCTEDGHRLPNGMCIRPRLEVTNGTEQHFWLDTIFHFPPGGTEHPEGGWVKRGPVTDNGFHDDMLGRGVDDDLWEYLNKGPDRYRFRLRESDFGWSWKEGEQGQRLAFDWRVPRINGGNVALGITICTTLRNW